MFELSEAEGQILMELWKLILSGRTIQEPDSEEAEQENSETSPEALDDRITYRRCQFRGHSAASPFLD